MAQTPRAPIDIISVVIEQNGDVWHAKVTRNGQTKEQEFPTEHEARTWIELQRLHLGTVVAFGDPAQFAT